MSSSDSETATIVVVVIVSAILIAVAVRNHRWIRKAWNRYMGTHEDSQHKVPIRKRSETRQLQRVNQGLVVYNTYSSEDYNKKNELQELLKESHQVHKFIHTDGLNLVKAYDDIDNQTSDPNKEYILCCTGVAAWVTIRTVQTLFDQGRKNIIVIAVAPLVSTTVPYNSYNSVSDGTALGDFFKSKDSDILVPDSPKELQANIHVYPFSERLNVETIQTYRYAATLHDTEPLTVDILRGFFQSESSDDDDYFETL
jgi:hypothetical protein